MKPVSPWSANTECPLEGFLDFKRHLNDASYHHAGSQQEWTLAKDCIRKAVEIAIEKEWPYWTMDRMFREIEPLVEWSQFMQAYINKLSEK